MSLAAPGFHTGSRGVLWNILRDHYQGFGLHAHGEEVDIKPRNWIVNSCLGDTHTSRQNLFFNALLRLLWSHLDRSHFSLHQNHKRIGNNRRELLIFIGHGSSLLQTIETRESMCDPGGRRWFKGRNSLSDWHWTFQVPLWGGENRGCWCRVGKKEKTAGQKASKDLSTTIVGKQKKQGGLEKILYYNRTK